MTQSFADAKKAYSSGKLGESRRILGGIHKRYPDFKPAYGLSGKILYKTGRPKLAAKMFQKAGLALMPARDALYWGHAFYSARMWSMAAKAYSVVREGAKVDLAQFYLGACLFRIGDNTRATFALRRLRPEKLPPSLRGVRRKMLQQLTTRRRAPATTRHSVPTYRPMPTAPIIPQPYPYPPTTLTQSKKPKPAKPSPETGLTFNATPSLSFVQYNAVSSDPGIKEQRLSESIQTTGVNAKTQYQGEPYAGEQPIIGLEGSLQVEQVKSRSTDLEFSMRQDSDVIITDESKSTSTATNRTMFIKPFTSFALGEGFSIDVSYRMQEYTPDSDARNALTSNVLAGEVGVEIGKGEIGLGGESTSNNDADGVNVSQVQTGRAVARYSGEPLNISLEGSATTVTDETHSSVPGSFRGYEQIQALNLNLAGDFSKVTGEIGIGSINRTPPSGKVVAGFKSKTSVSASLTLPLEFGMSIAMTGGMEQMSQFTDTSIPNGTNADGEAQTTSVNAEVDKKYLTLLFAVTPISWFTASFKYGYEDSVYTADNPDFQSELDKNNPGVVQSDELVISFSYTF